MARLAFDLSILRILLVEDDTFSREIEVTALQELGVSKITTALNEVEALDALARGVACDLIVFDWNMPSFDGVGLIKKVQESWPGIPVLMLTNNEGLDQIQIAQNAGADGCLIKPFSLDKLREAIQLALIAKLTSGKQATVSKPNAELDEILGSIKDVLAKPNGTGKAAPEETNKLAATVSNLLDGFVASLGRINQSQMEVIRLHADCLNAVLSGREDLLDHETQNLIVDGLNLAVDLVSDSQPSKGEPS